MQASLEPKATVEILGPWVLNKGDDLMLRAVVQRLGGVYELAASTPLGLSKNEPTLPGLMRIKVRPSLGEIRRAVRSLSPGRNVRCLGRLLLSSAPSGWLRRHGLVPDRRVRALLDCSGFAYGDQWSTDRTRRRIDYYTRLKAQGAKLVMLPQALGPFENPTVRDCTRRLFDLFDLIYARDRVSLEHVRALGVPDERVSYCPDITHLLRPPEVPAGPWSGRVCLVPNARMLDKTPAEVRRSYIDYLILCARHVRRRGLEPCLVLHERNDDRIAARIRAGLEFPVAEADEDAMVTKGILGSCHAVVSSRFHSIVSALSQGTPVLGTSWSHKYDAMFEEYGCREYLVPPTEAPGTIERALDTLLEPGARDALSARLKQVSLRQQRQVQAMWAEVEGLIQNHLAVPAPAQALLRSTGRMVTTAGS